MLVATLDQGQERFQPFAIQRFRDDFSRGGA